MSDVIVILIGWFIIAAILASRMIIQPNFAHSGNDIRDAPIGKLAMKKSQIKLPVNLSLSRLGRNIRQSFVRNSLGLSRKNHRTLGTSAKRTRTIKRN